MHKKKLFLNTYRHFKYFIFKLLYGKISKIITAKKNKKINIKKVNFTNSVFYNLYGIPNGRLYSDTTNDTAFILNNNLIKEPSFQYRFQKDFKIINGNINNNFVINNGTPNLIKKIKGNVFSLLTGGAGKNNYWHWLFDVLPRIGILEKSNYKEKPRHYLLPSFSKKYQIQSMLELKIPFSSLIDGESNKHIICDHLMAVDHPINFDNNPTESILNIPFWVIKWLNKKYIKNNFANSKSPKKIYINRKLDSNISTRAIINSKEVENTMKKLGFKSVTLSDLTFKNQIELFKNVNFIVGLHGAGFANMVFSKPGTKIVEIASHHSGDLFLRLAKNCKLNYKRIIEKNVLSSLRFQSSHIVVDTNKLKQLILSFR